MKRAAMDSGKVSERGQAVERVEGVLSVRPEKTGCVLEIGSGRYRFEFSVEIVVR